jgi:protein-arginine kinase activator protein McsA
MRALKSAVIPDEIKEIEREVQQLTRDKNEMVRQQEYEKAAKLRDQIGEANQTPCRCNGLMAPQPKRGAC